MNYIMSNKLVYYSTSMFFLFLSIIFNTIFNYLAKILIARSTSIEVLGNFFIIMSETQTLAIFVALGLFQALVIEIPRYNSKQRLNKIVSAFLYSCFMGLVLLMSSIILFFSVNYSDTVTFSLFVTSSGLIFLCLQSIFNGLKKFKHLFANNIIQGTIFLSLISIFIKDLSIESLSFFLFISYFSSSIIVLSFFIFFSNKHLLSEIFNMFLKNLNIKMISFSKRRFNLLFITLFSELNEYLVIKIPQQFGYINETSYIGIGRGIAAIIFIIPRVIFSSVSPIISTNYKKNNKDELYKIFKESLMILFLLQGITVIFFANFGNYILLLFYGFDYYFNSIPIFFFFLFIYVIMSIKQIFYAFLANTNKEKQATIGRFLSLIVFCLFSLFFIINSIDIIISIIISYFLGLLLQFITYYYFVIMSLDQYKTSEFKSMILWIILMTINIILACTSYIHINSILLRIAIFLINIIIYILFTHIIKLTNYKSLFLEIRTLLTK